MVEIGYTFNTFHNIIRKLIKYIDNYLREDYKNYRTKNTFSKYTIRFYYKIKLGEKYFNKSKFKDEKHNDTMIIIFDDNDIVSIAFDNSCKPYTSIHKSYNISSRYFHFRIDRRFIMTNEKLLIELLNIEEKLLNYHFYCEKYRDLCVNKIHKEYLRFLKNGK